MYKGIAVIVAALSLAACDSRETDARRGLTLAQGVQNEGRLLAALDAFEEVARKYPSTAAAKEAAELAFPLRTQRTSAERACEQYSRDTGQVPRDAGDFEREPAGAQGWNGPYVLNTKLGHFGRWIVKTECGMRYDDWPSNDRPADTAWIDIPAK